MRKIMIISLNSGGTMGHGKIISSLANSLSKKNKEVTIVSDMPFANKFHLDKRVIVTNIKIVPHANYTIGGMCNCSQKDEIFKLAKKRGIECAIFSTFFDLNLVKSFKEIKIKTILLSYPIRDTYRLALKQNGAYATFDRVITLYGPEFKDNMMLNEKLANPLKVVLNKTPNNKRYDICVTCGGGGRPSSKIFLRKVTKALKTVLKENPKIKIIIIKGNSKIKIEANNLNVILWTKDFGVLIFSSKIVIAEAGFFTMLDLINFKRNSILIPGERVIDNQELRALKLEKLGISKVFFPFEKVSKLSSVIKSALANKEDNSKAFNNLLNEFNKYPELCELVIQETK